MTAPGMTNLNDTEPGALLTEADFEAKLREPWQTTGADYMTRISDAGFRFVRWLCGGIVVGFIAAVVFGGYR